MAKYEMCTVFDMVALQYGRPFFTVSTGTAVRSLAHEVNTPSDSTLYRSPQDFQLFHIGAFDDERGVITLLPDRELLCRASDLAKPDDIRVANSPEPAVGA